jgi:hypothetical protein
MVRRIGFLEKSALGFRSLSKLVEKSEKSSLGAIYCR